MSLVVVLLWFWAAFANSLYARHSEFYFDCGVFYVVRRFQCDASFVGCRFCVYFPHFFGAWLCAGWYSAHICALLCSSIVFFPTSHFIKYISNLMRGVNRKSFHVKPVVSAFFALIFVPHVICCSTFCYSSKLFLSRSFFCSSFHCRRFVFRSFIDRLVITWNLNCSSTILQLCRQFIFIFGQLHNNNLYQWLQLVSETSFQEQFVVSYNFEKQSMWSRSWTEVQFNTKLQKLQRSH